MTYSRQQRERAVDAFGVVPGDDGQGRGDDGARAVHVEQRSRVLLEDFAHAFLQKAGLPFERLPCLGGGSQRGRHAPLDQAAGGPAFGGPVHAGLAPQSPVPFPDGLRGGDEQSVGRVGDRRHRRHQLGALGVEVAQCLDPAVRAFRQAGVVAGHDAAGGGDRVDGIGLAVPAAHASPGVFLQVGVHSMGTIFQQCRRLVSNRNCAVGTRRPFLPAIWS